MFDGLKPYPKMKDSGVPWLGEVPEHWDVRPLGRIGALFKGNGGNKGDEVAFGIPCVRYGDLYTRHEFFITRSKACVPADRAEAYTRIRYGDVLFAASGETEEDIGRSSVNLIEGEARCGGDILVLRPEIPAVPRYLGYASDSPPSRNQKACMGRGFTVVHIYGSELKRLTLALPPLPEQAAIVRFLDYADRRIRRYIRAKQKLIKLLEEQKQAIIHRAVTRGLDPNVRLKPSGVEWLGDVPEHWDVRKLGAVSTRVTKGTTPTTLGREFTDTGVRFVKVEAISKDRRVIPDACSHIDIETDCLLSRSRLRERDVLVAIAGAIGRVAVVCREDLPANCNQAVAIIRPTRELVSDWLAIVLSSPVHQRELTDKSVQSAQANLSLGDLRAITVPLPSVREQEEIVSSVGWQSAIVDRARDCAVRDISLLREYRTRLIGDVVTGKLDVLEAAARLPEESEDTEPLDEAEVEGDTQDAEADDTGDVTEEAEA